jgi:hypothetical protein
VIALAVFGITFAFAPILAPVLRKQRGLRGTFMLAAYQFTAEGLAPLALIAYRRESPDDVGLTRRRLMYSLTLALKPCASHFTDGWRRGCSRSRSSTARFMCSSAKASKDS